MSRSRKKCFWTISKAWDRFKERRYRKRVKEAIHEVEKEIRVDPDADFEEAIDHKKMGSWGTKIGLEYDSIKEGKDVWPEDEQIKHLEEGRRK